MKWEVEFLKFYNERVSFLNTSELTKHIVFRWIQSNVHLIAKEHAIDFAAWKEQNSKAKSLRELYDEYLAEQIELSKKEDEGWYSANNINELNKAY